MKKQRNSTILTNKQNINLYTFYGILNRNEMNKNCFLYIVYQTYKVCRCEKWFGPKCKCGYVYF